MRPVWLSVMFKEVLENARDRRVMLSALLYGPLVGPVLFAAMMAFILGQQQEESEKALELPVVGAEYAPTLVEFLQAQGVQIQPPPVDPEAAISALDELLVLRIPPEFPEQWRSGKPAQLELLFDRSRQKSQIPVERTRALLDGYANRLSAMRLQVRGIDPQITRPILLRNRDLSTGQSRAALMLAMLPYLLILGAFIGGMYLAIDTTAGERERGSLEPLLLSPAGRGEILTGKLLATTLFASASVLISVAAFAISMQLVPTAELGFVLRLELATLLQIALVMLPIALLASSAQMLVASFAKSFREAQTYLQFLMFIPIVPSLIMVLNPVKAQAWMFATPIFSQSMLINMLARGDSVSASELLSSVATTLLLALLLAAVTLHFMRRERFVLASS